LRKNLRRLSNPPARSRRRLAAEVSLCPLTVPPEVRYSSGTIRATRWYTLCRVVAFPLGSV
jgi:hypothetical protein